MAIASTTAGLLRVYWLGAGPLFKMPTIAGNPRITFAIGSLFLGAFVGLVSAGMSRMMYAFEDLFEHFHIHWMWWPALGGIGVGIGGLFFPRGLGVGYDNIAELLRGNATVSLIVGIILAKSLMWASSLGSGTSAGFCPIAMIGGAVGATVGHVLYAPLEAQAFWALIGMGSMLAGALGVPLTAILFSLEVTHCLPALLPLTIACISSYLITSLLMPRSILTEKLSRRGYHLSREYGVDPLDQPRPPPIRPLASASRASPAPVTRSSPCPLTSYRLYRQAKAESKFRTISTSRYRPAVSISASRWEKLESAPTRPTNRSVGRTILAAAAFPRGAPRAKAHATDQAVYGCSATDSA